MNVVAGRNFPSATYPNLGNFTSRAITDRTMRILHVLLVAAVSAARQPPRGSVARFASSRAPPPFQTPNAALLRACGAGFTLIETAQYIDPEQKSRGVVESCFGIAQATFEDRIKEPASGFLELVAPLIGL